MRNDWNVARLAMSRTAPPQIKRTEMTLRISDFVVAVSILLKKGWRHYVATPSVLLMQEGNLIVRLECACLHHGAVSTSGCSTGTPYPKEVSHH